jgi:hypothetical protein
MSATPNFCPACGVPVAPGERFCHECGASLVGAVVDLPPPQAATAAPPAPANQPIAVATPGAGAAPALQLSAVAVRLGAPTNVVSLMVALMIVVAAIALAISILLAGREQTATSDGTSSTAARQVIDVQNIKAEIPGDWDVLTRSGDTIAAKDRAGRTLWLRSAGLLSTISLDTVLDRFLDKARHEAPDAKVCAGPEIAVVPGGPVGGRYAVICSTFIPQGGGLAVRFADAYYIGLDREAANVFVMQLTATPESLQAFATVIHDLPPPVWKLFHE